MKKYFQQPCFLWQVFPEPVTGPNLNGRYSNNPGCMGKAKRELVSMAMALSKADSAKFWPEYDKYEDRRKKIGAERIKIIDDYVNGYEKMTNEKADALVNRIFRNDRSNSDLMQQYYVVHEKSPEPH